MDVNAGHKRGAASVQVTYLLPEPLLSLNHFVPKHLSLVRRQNDILQVEEAETQETHVAQAAKPNKRSSIAAPRTFRSQCPGEASITQSGFKVSLNRTEHVPRRRLAVTFL
ncbi:hypothetical protein AOLI_G00167030 [Acnodon oligacanthus]